MPIPFAFLKEKRGDTITVDFIADTTNPTTSPFSVVFTSSVTGPVISYEWFIDGISVSTAEHFSYDFDHAGLYTIKLTCNGQYEETKYNYISCGIKLETASDIDNIRNDLYASYVQVNDIDMSSIPDFTPITYFYGEIDGGMYSIDNFSITTAASDNALIKYPRTSVRLTNMRFTNFDITGTAHQSVLFAQCNGTCVMTIDNIYTQGIIRGTGNHKSGLIGRLDNAGVTGSINGCTVDVIFDDTSGGYNAPITGLYRNTSIPITNCSALGETRGSGETYAFGGYVGSPLTNIGRCYTCYNTNNKGIFNGSNGTTSNTYYNSDLASNSNTNGFEGNTTPNMKLEATYDGFDFLNVWGMNSGMNSGYPYQLGMEDLYYGIDITSPLVYDVQLVSISTFGTEGSNYNWKLNGTTVSTNAILDYIFPVGTYDISVTYNDYRGRPRSFLIENAIESVSVDVIDFTVDTTNPTLAPFSVTFTGISFYDDLEWFVDGVSVGIGSTLTYDFDTTGEYDITLEVDTGSTILSETKEDFIQAGRLLETASDVYDIRYNLNGEYLQINDIDLSTYPDWSPIVNFSGVINGNKYTLDNLTITTSAYANALCMNISGGAEFYGLRVTNANISGAGTAGILIGDATTGGELIIEDCYFHGQVTGTGTHDAGIVGRLDSVTLTGYMAMCATDISLSNSNTYGGMISGLIRSTLMTFDDIYLGGTSNNCAAVGGYMELPSNVMTNIVANVDIASTTRGCFFNTSGAVQGITCYYNSDTTSVSNNMAFVGKTTTEMKIEGNYSGLDFTNVWKIDPNYNDGFPYLRNLIDVYEI